MRAARAAAALLLLTLLAARVPAGDEDVLGRKVDLPQQPTTWFHRDGTHLLYALAYHRPLLLVFWRADDKRCCEKVVPAMLELAQEHAEDVLVVFLERSGLSPRDMLRVACRERWLDTPALWTCDRLDGIEPEQPPAFVIATTTREVVATGEPLADLATLRSELRWQVQLRRLGAPYLGEPARAAWKALRDGHLREALALRQTLDALIEADQPGDAALVRELSTQLALIEGEIATRIELAIDLRASGYLAASLPRFDALQVDLADLPAEHPIRRRLDTAREAAVQVGDPNEEAASKELVELQEQLFRAGPGKALGLRLAKLAERQAGTAAGERAALLATMASPD